MSDSTKLGDGELTLFIDQEINDEIVTFGISLDGLGHGGSSDSGGTAPQEIKVRFFKRETQDPVTGLWSGKEVKFNGQEGAAVEEVALLDVPLTGSQTGPIGNVEMTNANGLKVYFAQRVSRDETTGLWDALSVTTNGGTGKAVDSILLLDKPPTGSQTGPACNAQFTKAVGLKIYFAKRFGLDSLTGLWMVRALTSNGGYGATVKEVLLLDNSPT